MAELIDISNEKFWDILFDEACVEGQQAERIETALKQIATTEAEIRAKAIDEFAEKLSTDVESFVATVNGIEADLLTLDYFDEFIFEIAEQLKECE